MEINIIHPEVPLRDDGAAAEDSTLLPRSSSVAASLTTAELIPESGEPGFWMAQSDIVRMLTYGAVRGAAFAFPLGLITGLILMWGAGR